MISLKLLYKVAKLNWIKKILWFNNAIIFEEKDIIADFAIIFWVIFMISLEISNVRYIYILHDSVLYFA